LKINLLNDSRPFMKAQYPIKASRIDLGNLRNLSPKLLLGLLTTVFPGCNPDQPSSSLPPINPALRVPLEAKANPEPEPDEPQPEKPLDQVPATQVPTKLATTGGATLAVEVLGLAGSDGRCRLALYRNQEGFNQPEKAFAKETLAAPNQGPLVWTIELEASAMQGPQTRWAVSAHHDENGNDKLDKNAFGIPTEPYGFSNNPKRGFGPPKFDEVSFSVDGDASKTTKRIEIKIQ
jgi:uncharacterized protein (DUF2141 family)